MSMQVLLGPMDVANVSMGKMSTFLTTVALGAIGGSKDSKL
jgi:hypothetical protein